MLQKKSIKELAKDASIRFISEKKTKSGDYDLEFEANDAFIELAKIELGKKELTMGELSQYVYDLLIKGLEKTEEKKVKKGKKNGKQNNSID